MGTSKRLDAVESEAEFEARYRAALKAGAQSQATEPHARAVSFDPETGRVTLTLNNGASIGFDAASVRELADATKAQLAELSLSPSGSTLSLRSLDVDIAVEGLVLSVLGSAGWTAAMRAHVNRELARSQSEARRRASRENGKKGGRPPAKGSNGRTQPVRMKARPGDQAIEEALTGPGGEG